MDKTGKKSCSAPSEDATAQAVFGIRLVALPPDVLRTVLRLAGSPARGACRALRDGYGPLDGGLYLEHFTTRAGSRLSDLIATSRGGYRNIHTLILRPHPSTTCLGFALLRSLPATFPTLRSLHLGAPITITLTHFPVRHLAPLAPHLTSLAAAFGDLPSLAALATTLTSLRELALDGKGYVCDSAPDTISTLHPLAPALLNLTCKIPSRANAAQVLRSLAPFTRLTHLDLPATDSWDQEAFGLLATVMPRLQALQLAYFDDDLPPSPLADNICSALARRTALTSLTASWEALPYNPSPLRLAQLRLTECGSDIPQDPVPLLDALAPARTLTRLEVVGQFWLGPDAISALCQFADTLQSLTWHGWSGCAAWLPALLPLSKLTRLESLSLDIVPPFSDDERLRGEQVASAIAAALPRLTSLQLQAGGTDAPDVPPHHHLAALLGAVARRGALRHLAVSCWDLQWGSSLLAPLATSLVRLTLPSHPVNILRVVESLSGLEALLCLYLHCTIPKVVQVGGAPLPALRAVGGVDGTSCESAAAEHSQHAGSERPAGWHHAAEEGEAHTLRVQLPPRLRQLCLEQPAGFCMVQWHLEAEMAAALLAAASRQGCVVRVDRAGAPLSSVRHPQHDDCHGYRDGASAEWVEARRRQQTEDGTPAGLRR